jgi:hypothetical protein
MTRHRALRGLLLWIGLAIVAGCAPMTPAQQDAVELRRHCERNPLADLERCFAFVGSPGA